MTLKFFRNWKFSKFINRKKKYIYRIWPRKKKKKGKKKKVNLDSIESIEMKKESFGSLEVKVGVWKWFYKKTFGPFPLIFSFVPQYTGHLKCLKMRFHGVTHSILNLQVGVLVVHTTKPTKQHLLCLFSLFRTKCPHCESVMTFWENKNEESIFLLLFKKCSFQCEFIVSILSN
jgi:hypothetical protein